MGLTLTADLGGCAPSERSEVVDETRQARLPQPQGECIFVNTISDWRAVDARRLWVRTRARGWQFEVELTHRCSDILFTEAIAWPSTDNRICDFRGDAVVVRRQRCRIGAIRRLPQEGGNREQGTGN